MHHNSSSWQIRHWIPFWTLCKECWRAQAAHSKLLKDVIHLKRLMLVIHSHCSSHKSLSNNPPQHLNRPSCYSNCKQCWLSRVQAFSPNHQIYRQKNNKGQWAHWKTKAFLKIGSNYSCLNFQRILRVPGLMPLRINESQVANLLMTRNN